jgi:hypothetical protein
MAADRPDPPDAAGTCTVTVTDLGSELCIAFIAVCEIAVQ